MVKVKPMSQITANYKSAIGSVPAKYKTGIEGTTDWQSKAMAGEDLYAEKIQEAISNQSRARGISRVSDGEWKSAAAGKGAARIGAGMNESLPKYTSIMTEVRSVLEGVSLPERVADPMQNIDNRVKPIAQALHNWKANR